MFGFGKGDTNSLTMNKAHPESLLDSSAQDVIGKPIDRIDGPKKVSGKATYAAEYALDNVAYGYLVRATVGAGKITKLDAETAKAMPGVIDVITDYATFLRNPQQGGETEAPTQGVEQVAYYGEIIAIVVAESYEAARDAALRLHVDYAPSEGRYDFQTHRNEAEKPSPQQIPPYHEQGDIEEGMKQAQHRIDVTYTTPSQNSAAMEPHASLAVWEDGALTLYGAYQMPASDKQQLAKSLGVSADKVRIVAAYVGGGFGSKLGIAPESVAAAIAAKRLGRPVKAVMARQQVFDATVRRSNTEQRMRLGADADGKLIAIGHETITSNLPGEDYFEPAGMATHFLYDGENRLITHDIVRLDWTLSGSMRAPGEAVGLIALEGAIDELAEEIGIDPIELRRRNEPEQDPEKKVPYSSRMLIPCLERGAERFGWAKRKPAGTDRRGDWLYGIGVASAARSNQLQKSAAKVSIDGQGKAHVETDMTDIGTGTYTILGQITAEILGLPIEDVIVHLGDTDAPPGAGSGGSWGAGSSGSSVYLACEALRGQIAKAMGVDEPSMTLKDGRVIADNRSVPLAELVGDGMEATGEIAPGRQEKTFNQASYGAHFAEVAVNVVTGEVRVKRMLGVFTAGRILNEKTARSQCLGGMTFGIGSALTEELVHDPRNGKVVNRDLGEYHVPVNADVPQLEVEFLHERDIQANPLHAKGLGEVGICGAAAAVGNAIYNATGVRVRDYPLTLDKLLDGLPVV
ncbi:xanthine dehydrogenase family protein molybdopterin-binding subunit [Sphingomonas sp. RIT328]|uniref:xanthine dehydrogenase family protein molybdopterin-binding subunit n=1 Tax=Sphingomonas sp. RIT328 TaxID=1470591 RepID=UPI00044CD8A2|nr:xanthine dehydrogenase family protein molybdopterin-binding subunit [Sphingomonas sp. RIT328]EZP56550.1 Aldehyde oxidase and xanthine dehydrogenase, a/b hammerhead domain protein [Sphingomonas sp. RIT328]